MVEQRGRGTSTIGKPSHRGCSSWGGYRARYIFPGRGNRGSRPYHRADGGSQLGKKKVGASSICNQPGVVA
jgi:hypothetical protein